MRKFREERTSVALHLYQNVLANGEKARNANLHRNSNVEKKSSNPAVCSGALIGYFIRVRDGHFLLWAYVIMNVAANH
jgi:hypothetical protein